MTTRNPQIGLTGDRNECPGCNQLFNSSLAFDKHRVGTFTPPTRHCLTQDQMLAKGMSRNAAGFWITKAMPTSLRHP